MCQLIDTLPRSRFGLVFAGEFRFVGEVDRIRRLKQPDH